MVWGPFWITRAVSVGPVHISFSCPGNQQGSRELSTPENGEDGAPWSSAPSSVAGRRGTLPVGQHTRRVHRPHCIPLVGHVEQ
jgi:hypothetical protein